MKKKNKKLLDEFNKKFVGSGLFVVEVNGEEVSSGKTIKKKKV
jgi:hypothetical protein